MELLELYNNSKFRDIINFYDSSSFNPISDPHSAFLISASFFQLSQYEECLNLLENIESAMQGEAHYFSLFGACLRRLGFFERAKNYLHEALRLSPNDPSVKNNYANLLIDLKSYIEAKDILKALLVVDPNYEDAKANLNRLEFYLQNPVKSNPSASCVPEVSQRSTPNLNLDPLLNAFSNTEVRDHGRFKKQHTKSSPSIAINEVNRLPAVDTSSYASEQIILARKAISESNFKFALELCSNANKVLGANPNLYDCVSDAYIGLKKFFEAEIYILHTLQLSHPTVKHYINLVNISVMRGDLKLGLYYFDRATGLDPKHPNLPKIKFLLDKAYSSDSQQSFNFIH